MDAAASEFYDGEKYVFGLKKGKRDKVMTGEELASYYLKLINKYPIISIEDPFAEDDWESWQYFIKKTQICFETGFDSIA